MGPEEAGGGDTVEVGTVPSPGTAGASPESLDRGPTLWRWELSPPARLAEPGEAPQGTIRGTASGKERGSSHQCPIGLLSPASASTWSAAPGQQLEHRRSSPPIDTHPPQATTTEKQKSGPGKKGVTAAAGTGNAAE